MLTSALAGFGLGLSLIIAIGAQNLFVLRQGIRRDHVFAVAVVCAASDAALIVLGVSGVGLVLNTVPWLIDAVRWAGAAFLVGYGLLAARRALRPTAQSLLVDAGTEHASDTVRPAGAASDTARPSGAGTVATPTRTRTRTRTRTQLATPTRTRTRFAPVLLTCLALTWLNPHVYLDTVFLLGSVASTHGDGRWAFAAGAVGASVLWFFALAFGARHLGRPLATPRAWRILDAVIAIVMVGLGISLVLPH